MDNYGIRRLILDRDLLGAEGLDVSYKLGFPAPESTEYYHTMRSQGFSHDEILAMIDDMEIHLNEEVSEHLRQLMEERDTTTYQMEKAGLSGRMLREVLRGKRLSDDTFRGVCLFLELSEEEVEEFLAIRGQYLTNSIQDVTFKKFIEKGMYGLEDFVTACWELANEAGVELPAFYEGGYTNDTYRSPEK